MYQSTTISVKRKKGKIFTKPSFLFIVAESVDEADERTEESKRF